MICLECGNEIPIERQRAVADERLCKSCVEALGDVEPIRGAMIYPHKTGGYLELTGNVNEILRNSRKGNHAQLPLGSKAKAEATTGFAGMSKTVRDSLAEMALEPVRLSARCHPERPRVSPDGKCLECVRIWYQKSTRSR